MEKDNSVSLSRFCFLILTNILVNAILLMTKIVIKLTLILVKKGVRQCRWEIA